MGKPLSLHLSDAAEADLAEIWAYIATEASEAVATRFLLEIEEEFGVILQTPLIGAKRERFAPGLRVTFHGSYAIYYLPAEQELVIVRILHGARDIGMIAEHGGFNRGGE